MGETSKIHSVIRQARSRLRRQEALEVATLVSVFSFPVATAAVYLFRVRAIDGDAALASLIAAAALIAVGAVWGYVRSQPQVIVANRIDRACGLADRLGTACDFEERLRRGEPDDEQTRAFMMAAIDDALRHLPRADARAATRHRWPVHAPASAAFACIGLALCLFYFRQDPAGQRGPHTGAVARADTTAHDEAGEELVELDPDDLDYSRDLVEELRQTAERTGDHELKNLADQLDALLDRAANGELGKQELLKQFKQAEQAYAMGADQAALDESMADLRKTGAALKNSPITRDLGKALEQGDLDKAGQEMEKLAQSLDDGKLSDKDKESLAKAMEKAADAFERAKEQKEEKAKSELARKQEDLRRLRQKMENEKDPEQREREARRLEKTKREVERLERKQEEQRESRQRRLVERLHRDMKRTAQDLRQRGQRSQRQASRRMRDLSRNTGEVDQDRKRVNNQQKVATQVQDLKEALRRAKRNGKVMSDRFGKNRRNRGQGQRGGQRPGQEDRPGRSGQRPGDGQGGSKYGDEDGGNPLGVSTEKGGSTRDETLAGAHGRGESTSQTILTAAKKGFASKAYRSVYGNYKTVIEDVMVSEKVPSGYRRCVKKYFHDIKPREE